MTFLVTVAANHLSGLGAILRTMAFLTTVVARTTTSATASSWAITSKMASLATVLALYILCRSRFGALFSCQYLYSNAQYRCLTYTPCCCGQTACSCGRQTYPDEGLGLSP